MVFFSYKHGIFFMNIMILAHFHSTFLFFSGSLLSPKRESARTSLGQLRGFVRGVPGQGDWLLGTDVFETE